MRFFGERSVEDLLQGAAPVQHISATACDEIGTEDNEPKPSSGDLGLGSQGAHRGHKRKRPTSGDSGLPGVFDLNVGGIVFQTRRETLRNSPTLRTIIDGMAEGQPVDVDENGRLFVDRNPHTFEVILRVLQVLAPPSSMLIHSRWWVLWFASRWSIVTSLP